MSGKDICSLYTSQCCAIRAPRSDTRYPGLTVEAIPFFALVSHKPAACGRATLKGHAVPAWRLFHGNATTVESEWDSRYGRFGNPASFGNVRVGPGKL